MKKVLSLLVAIAMLISIVPAGFMPSAEANNVYFLFPNEQSTPESARIVSTSTIQLEGTINQVVGNTISYNIEQLGSDGKEFTRTEEITTGIQTTGDNRITVSGIQLFPGLNKITFKGISGASTVSESIYIEYRDSPMLYDLKINFENREHVMKEEGATMLYATTPNTSNQGQIVITGKAPNAQKVTIIINGRSFDFNVATASNESRFSTSQLTLDAGINKITFKVYNGGQVTETSYDVALYSGSVTYYNLKLTDSAQNESNLTPNLNFLTADAGAGKIQVSGTAIIPLPLYNLAAINPNNVNQVVPVSPIQIGKLLSFELAKGGTTIETKNFTPDNITIVEETSDFVTVNFKGALPQLDFEQLYQIRFKGPNKQSYSHSNYTPFTIRNNTISYIHDIRHLSGYDKGMSDDRIKGLQGSIIPADGVNVYTMPMALEVLIGNYDKLGNNRSNLFKMNNKEAEVDGPFSQLGATEVVYRMIDGKEVPFLRTFIEINRLPKSGTNTIKFKLNGLPAAVAQEEKSIIAKLLYGPYVKFDQIANNSNKEFDTVNETAVDLIRKLGNFQGQIFNVANENQIVYETNGTNKQTVFLYLNNVEIELVAVPGSKTKFRPKDLGTANNKDIMHEKLNNIINKAGENTLKFIFTNSSNIYENVMKFNVMPKNLPVVPALETDGVYPYTGTVRNPNDTKFTKQGSVYTTKEAAFNVYGTFDFLDLGNKDTYVNGHNNITSKENYKVVINSPNWKTPVTWDLTKEMIVTNKGERIGVLNEGLVASTPDASITFYYEVEGQYFYFDIKDQKMPIDGSPQVFTITVFNSGDAGPRGSYRLEVNSVSIPYSLKAPLPENMVTNHDYVEVIIESPGADSIMIGKQPAEKVTYIEYVAGQPKYMEAYRAIVKKLKANSDTKIDFTITRGTDTLKDTVTVKYVPTNIPGAQTLQTMASSHKAFNNALTLSFPKGTQLIRPKFNNSEKLAGQVASGHDILMAIASPNDGIINRREFESQAPNYTANSQAEGNLHIGYRFQDQARQFIKASPLYWIDAGLADEPITPALDSEKVGQDPFPYPNLVGKYADSFAKRYNKIERQLIPSQEGKLTLSYDKSVVDSASTTITVFRFDPFTSMWENIGGVVDPKKYTVTVPFSKFGYYVAVKMTRGYNDITDHPYARDSMEAVFAKGVMNAIDPIGVFGGDRYVTRGEFTRMIVRALDLPLNYEGDHHFTYYPETVINALNANSIYDYRYIETAARAGIVRGTRPGFFDEDVELSRQEAGVMIARALKLKLETDSTKAKNNLNKVFKDGGNFDFYSIPSILAIQKKGFIQGKYIDSNNPKGGMVFEPKARLLRSDAAIIMSKVMNDLKKLPKIYN
ncbi:S-layer homology domain-containing protein [Paenibacillus yanchengensis]|uniref:S-layer homology domain-containing protein n=1 Tax=Paenibacillus yanchengensis TaxID=2035833 RepID=A0ABW4YNF5_9BACL